jgi:hypothetical protein
VFLYARNDQIIGPKINANGKKRNRSKGSQKSKGSTPKNHEGKKKTKKTIKMNNPNMVAGKIPDEKMKAFMTGFPCHRTFSSVRSCLVMSVKLSPIFAMCGLKI